MPLVTVSLCLLHVYEDEKPSSSSAFLEITDIVNRHLRSSAYLEITDVVNKHLRYIPVPAYVFFLVHSLQLHFNL